MRHRLCSSFSVLVVFWAASLLEARVVRTEISSRTDVAGGKLFGAAGGYERLTGKIHFSIRAADPRNLRIVDVQHAVNLRDGEVAFSADFIAVRPKDPARSNGALLLEIPNRGKSRIIGLVDGGDWSLAQNTGDGWLLRNGYTVVSLGWQWDAVGPGALRLYAPVAKEGGKTIRGLLRGDLMPATKMDDIPLGHLITGDPGGTEYPVSDPADNRNVLTVRDSRDAKRTVLPRSSWQFAHLQDGKLVPSDYFIHLHGGFQPGKLYEYVYVVCDPVVAGLGFAAVRDFVSYAKHTPGSIAPAARVYAEGISQNGRFLRDYLYEGFNIDEQSRPALDGVLAHVAGAGRGSFNYRFAQPSRDAQPTSSVYFPTDIFPFTDQPETDPVTGERAGLLDVSRATRSTPKIFLSNTSYEYWGRVASLIHSSADGKTDVPISEDVRIYHFTGLQHFPGPFPPARGAGDLNGEQPESPLPIRYFWRAMITNMNAWVRDGRKPPESSYPRIANGTLVALSHYAFPDIPGVAKPTEANVAYHLDYGPNWRDGILSVQPPKVGAPFAVLVPQVDRDGNEMDGVRLPEIQAPLATYTGWNWRAASIGAPGQRVPFEGSYLPFPKSARDRQAARDPRKSIAERYSGSDDYLARYSKAIDQLISQHWILPEDRASLLQQGEREWSVATQ